MDVAPKFPFYDEVMGGVGYEQQDDDNWIKVQPSLIASSGDFTLLQHLSSTVGLFVNHQESFAAFKWEMSHLLVSVPHFH